MVSCDDTSSFLLVFVVSVIVIVEFCFSWLRIIIKTHAATMAIPATITQLRFHQGFATEILILVPHCSQKILSSGICCLHLGQIILLLFFVIN